MVVNITGSFLIGLLMTLLSERLPHPHWRLLLVVGFLGGYTTFPALSGRRSARFAAAGLWIGLANVVGSVALGYAAVWLGATLATRR